MTTLFAFVLGAFFGSVWQAHHHRRHRRAVAIVIQPTGDIAVQNLTLGKPFVFKIEGRDADGQPAELKSVPAVAVDGAVLLQSDDGSYTFTPTLASGVIASHVDGLPDISESYAATAAAAVSQVLVPVSGFTPA